MIELSRENYILFAAKYYTTIHYTVKEFNSDIKRISYIKKLLNKYLNSGQLSERLILNHLILIFNVFDKTAAQKMLFYKMKPESYPALKTFLVYLNLMPDEIIFNNTKIISTDIYIDMNIANILRDL